MDPIIDDLEKVYTNVVSTFDTIRNIPSNQEIRDRLGDNGTIQYTLTKTEFSVQFVNSYPPNNISFTWDRPRSMFKLGLTLKRIDPTLNRPPISGTFALHYLEKVAKQLGIDQIFIADSSFVKCNADTEKEIDNFLLLRILTGKEGFYKKPSTNYLNRELALETIALLRDTFMTDEKKAILADYSTSTDSAVCDRVNALLTEAKEFLLQKEREDSKRYLESIKHYIMRPGSVGGRRRVRKTRKSLRKKKTRRVSK